jgi:7-cyano-7-deazaguanine synthase
VKTVVLLSGGLDSAVALAMQRNTYLTTLTVDYGQRHIREVDAAADIAAHYQVPNLVVTVDPRLFGGSALTEHHAPLPDGAATAPDATYVPARNTVLLALAAAHAETLGARRIVIGANADDAGAYPDCRARYIQAFRDVLCEGTLGHVWVDAPLITTTKAEIIDLAHQLDVPIDRTWSCYAGGNEPCGRCGACQLREAHA